LRDYGVPGQLGLEKTPEEFVQKMVEVMREVRRVLRDDGTLWLNLGSTFSSGKQPNRSHNDALPCGIDGTKRPDLNWKAKDLISIPWMVAFALQADGWYLRSDIIWCLSGGTWLYARTQKGDMPIMVRDMTRLDPSTVQLWNGEKWTQLLGMNKNARRGTEIEIVLRSGERISCTPTHRFPTSCGLVDASEIKVGDGLQACKLPEPETQRDCAIDIEAAWFAGLYIAEGSKAGDTIQIAGHVKEVERWKRIQNIAAQFGGTATMTETGNTQNIRVYGKVLNAILDELVTGRIAKDKGFAPVVWRYSNAFISSMLDGYLSGDGFRDVENDRWRLGFTRNYNLERDLRTACARLGYHLTLKLSRVAYDGRVVPIFRGEIRMKRSGHHNERNMGEVMGIRKARCREVYDIGVADEPHLFSLASGILTYNSKPNPMPESVTDRPTKAHEYLFLLTKSARYYYDAIAIQEQSVTNDPRRPYTSKGAKQLDGRDVWHSGERRNGETFTNRNARSVWIIATQPFSQAHFAVFPEKLVEPCIKAGTSEMGCCPKCGAGWRRVVEKEKVTQVGRTPKQQQYLDQGLASSKSTIGRTKPWGLDEGKTITLGWQPSCSCGFYTCSKCSNTTEVVSEKNRRNNNRPMECPICGAETTFTPYEPIPCVVLDCFCGAATVGLVAKKLQRDFIGIELKPEYVVMGEERIARGK
jgi:DNA modification methylase